MNQRNPRVETRKLALTAVLAAIYTIARAIPISRLIGISGTITFAGPGRTTARKLSLVAVFAALYAALRYIPTFPMYGLSGTSFRASDFLAPILGMLLGPWLSIPCIVTGTFINYALAPPVFLGLDFLPGCTAAIIAGLMSTGRRKHAIALYAALLGIFLVLPLSTFWIRVPGGYQVPYTWLHMSALVILVSSLGLKRYKWTVMSTGRALVIGALLTVLSATLAQHLTGGILYELILFPVSHITSPSKASLFWSFIFYLYPIERTIITVVSTLLAVSLFRAIRSAGLERSLGLSFKPIPLASRSAFRSFVYVFLRRIGKWQKKG